MTAFDDSAAVDSGQYAPCATTDFFSICGPGFRAMT